MSKVQYKQGDIIYMDFSPAVDFEMEGWSPVNKIDNLNRDFFVLCHD